MKNTLQKIPSFEQYSKLKENGFTAHDYQTSEFIQDLIPFLQEVQSVITYQQSVIEYLQNRVQHLDSLI